MFLCLFCGTFLGGACNSLSPAPGCGVTIAGVARSQKCPGGGNKSLHGLLLWIISARWECRGVAKSQIQPLTLLCPSLVQLGFSVMQCVCGGGKLKRDWILIGAGGREGERPVLGFTWILQFCWFKKTEEPNCPFFKSIWLNKVKTFAKLDIFQVQLSEINHHQTSIGPVKTLIPPVSKYLCPEMFCKSI